jgi:hypothetical protein
MILYFRLLPVDAQPERSYHFDESRERIMPIPLEVFCCYAREDLKMLKHLKKSLMPLQQSSQITIWSDTNLNAGVEWEKELHQHLESADLILLLISPDFMSSDYCYSTEMKRAIERHTQGDAHVIPILLRPIHWDTAPFAKLQMIPTNARYVTSWPNRDEAFYDIANHINQIVAKFILPQTNVPSPATSQVAPEIRNLPSRNSRDFFCVGCGVGRAGLILILPPEDDGRFFHKFIESLTRIGELLSNSEVASFTDIKSAFITADTIEDRKEVAQHFDEIMGKLSDRVRNNSSEENFKWFRFGQLLYKISWSVFLDAEVPSFKERPSSKSLLDALEELLNGFELDPLVTKKVTNFIAKARKSRSKGGILEMANQIAEQYL